MHIPFLFAQTADNLDSLKKILMDPKGAMIAGSILVMMILSRSEERRVGKEC